MRVYKFFILLFLLLIFIKFSFACDKNAQVHYSIKAIDQKDLSTISEYQFPDFKEDDLLIVNSVIIENKGDCDIPESMLEFNLTKPSGEEKWMCILNIPLLGKTESYIFNETSLKEENKQFWGGWDYYCKTGLNKEGEYSIKLSLKERRSGDNIAISTGLVSNNIISPNKFKVYSKYTFREFELLKIGFLLSFVSMLSGVGISFGIGVLYKGYNDKIKKRKAIKSLVYEIEKNISFAKEILDKKTLYLSGKVPFKNFITLNLIKVISSEIINNSEVFIELLYYYDSLLIMNNFIIRMRLPNIPQGSNDLKNVIGLIEEGHIEKAQELINKLKNLAS